MNKLTPLETPTIKDNISPCQKCGGTWQDGHLFIHENPSFPDYKVNVRCHKCGHQGPLCLYPELCKAVALWNLPLV